MSHHETLGTPDSAIHTYEIPTGQLRSIEAHVANVMGVDEILMCPKGWLVDPEDTEALRALSAITEIAGGLTKSNPYYAGAGTIMSGDRDRPNALSFVSTTLGRRELDTVRDEVVVDVNRLLEKLQSPYKL